MVFRKANCLFLDNPLSADFYLSVSNNPEGRKPAALVQAKCHDSMEPTFYLSEFVYICLVGARGFEPPTPCSQSRCATRLRYAPMKTAAYHACRLLASQYERDDCVRLIVEPIRCVFPCPCGLLIVDGFARPAV
jgi:hypothetical protein